MHFHPPTFTTHNQQHTTVMRFLQEHWPATGIKRQQQLQRRMRNDDVITYNKYTTEDPTLDQYLKRYHTLLIHIHWDNIHYNNNTLITFHQRRSWSCLTIHIAINATGDWPFHALSPPYFGSRPKLNKNTLNSTGQIIYSGAVTSYISMGTSS